MARFCLAELSLLILFLLALTVSSEARERKLKELRRNRREWLPPPAKLMENTDYTHLEHIAKIRSDKDTGEKIGYFLSGEGADQQPFNLFNVDYNTGFVRVTGILDREKCPVYNLKGIAKYRNGTTAEDDIPLTIIVLDQNDESPYIELHAGNVTEESEKGTFVMKIKGKDKDEPETINSKLSYRILSQEPKDKHDMFVLNEETGELYVKEHNLDREIHDFYKLVVKVTDMGGAAGGLTGTGTVEIKILDINDNIPTLEKSEYSGSVDENVADVVVMRIKALDKDLEHTNNWLTRFTITKGNEDNLFSIETDEETNEGILKLIKPVDFEEIQNLELGLLIENFAPFVKGGAISMDVEVQVGEGGAGAGGAGAAAGAGIGADVGVGADLGVDVGLDVDVNVDADLDADLEGGVDVGLDAGLKPEAGAGPGVGIKPGVGPGAGSGLKPGKPKPNAPKSYPIKIAVNNVPEGPAFVPNTKNVPVSEDPKETPEDSTIAVFTAVDPDTGKPAEDVSYAKAYDPGNWFTIDEETAEIKLNKVPDRESPFLVNGTYTGKILAVTKDMPSKTATGTIAIQVTDSNDHCPTLTTTYSDLCSNKKSVYVTAFDKDASPNAAPFTFRIIPDGTRGSWVVEVINETSAALHSLEALWPGSYELQVEILDFQGLSCPTNEVFIVDVCNCDKTEDCSIVGASLGSKSTSSELSAPAIGLLLIASCLLMFIPLLLLFCQCGGPNTVFPDQFSDLPFDTKEQLISYHTEGRGEDKEVTLQSSPIMLGTIQKFETGQPNLHTINSKIMKTHETRLYNESEQKFQEIYQNTMEIDNACLFSRESVNHGIGSATFSRKMLGIQHTAALYEDIALPDAFLNDYYSQKATCAVPVNDCLLEYDFEGQGSSAGSVGCCSLLDHDNDLLFLTDLGPKFKTLAEICIPPPMTPKPFLPHNVVRDVKSRVDCVEPVSKSKLEHTVDTKHIDNKLKKVTSSTNMLKSSVSTMSAAPSMTLPQSKITRIRRSSDISHSDKLPGSVQTVLLQQQPIYYTSPIPQPIQYIVQPHLQNTLLLADGSPRTNFPGAYLVSDSQDSPRPLISGSQRSSSGLVIQDIESFKSPASPTCVPSPTVFLYGSPSVSPGSVEGWKIMQLDADGNYRLLKDKSSPDERSQLDSGSSQGILSRGVVLVKEAASPQGVLDSAAQKSLYGTNCISRGDGIFSKMQIKNRNLQYVNSYEPHSIEKSTQKSIFNCF